VRVYLIRHAESEFNARRIHQFSTTPLSARGVEQAGLLARRLAYLPVDVLLTSTHERARQTAAVVARAVEREVQATPLLVEVKRPSIIEGRGYDEPDVVAIKAALARAFGPGGWRHSDEETFDDLVARGRKCLGLLRSLDARLVVAITHGYFLTVLVALMLHGDELSPRDIVRLERHTRIANTGITRCDYGPDDGWTLVTWNDHAHRPEEMYAGD
jgi:broad specificity phosphatase PhoE